MARLDEQERSRQREIGTRIAERRELLHLTQPVVADRVGVSLRAYQNWEAGDTRIAWPNLERLAGILEVPVDEILHGIEDDEEPPISMDQIAARLDTIEARLDTIDQNMIAALNNQGSIQDYLDQLAQAISQLTADTRLAAAVGELEGPAAAPGKARARRASSGER